MPIEKQLRVNIIGAGLSGGALANALLNDPEKRFKVQLFERDDMAFSSERGGYQIRLGKDGIWGLKECLDPASYEEMRGVWGNGPFHTFRFSECSRLMKDWNRDVASSSRDQSNHWPSGRLSE